MSIPDVFTAIEMDLDDDRLPPNRIQHYVLPRRVGTTTFLVGLANTWAAEGRRVAFVVPNHYALRSVRERLEDGVTVFVANDTWRLRGWAYDALVGDCVGPAAIADLSEFIRANVHGPALFIDSGKLL